tara:strand:- start:278 stop:457 length:180 start_codon:yes stop_codon:yes gene_type:complete
MKKNCKSCKKKNIEELNSVETKEKANPLVYTLLIIYTLLAGYGLVTLITDISTFISKLL